jgi:hypothetical protein
LLLSLLLPFNVATTKLLLLSPPPLTLAVATTATTVTAANIVTAADNTIVTVAAVAFIAPICHHHPKLDGEQVDDKVKSMRSLHYCQLSHHRDRLR